MAALGTPYTMTELCTGPRWRAAFAAAVLTVIIVAIVIAGLFFMGVWKIRGAIDEGALNCSAVMPLPSTPRPFVGAAAGDTPRYRPDLALSLLQFVSSAYLSVCAPADERERATRLVVTPASRPANAPANAPTAVAATEWRRVGKFVGNAAPAIGGGADEVYGYAWLGYPLSRQPNSTHTNVAPVLVFAFRGTLSLAGWIADFNFPQQESVVLRGAPVPAGLVAALGGRGAAAVPMAHQGFENLYLTMREAVIAVARRHPSARVLVCGHSLGGALASFAAADIALRGGVAADGGGAPRYLSSYTYGCPRIGNAALAAAWTAAVPDGWRVVNTADAVPTVPPPGIDDFGYVHTPQRHEFYLQNRGILANHSINTAYTPGLERGL